jgi:hypothetical protein
LTPPSIVLAAVEGDADEAVLARLAETAGLAVGTVYGGKGKAYLKAKISHYNLAARHYPWIVLVDLDDDEDCAPDLTTSWLPQMAPLLCFRVAVRAVEAWLLADGERFSQFFSVPLSRIPPDVEAVRDPKAAVLALAQRSRRAAIREDMVPRAGSGRREGPLYTPRLIEFIQDASAGWRPEVAAGRSDSLGRCYRALRRLAADLTTLPEGP